MDSSVYQVYEDEIQLLEEEIKLLSEKYEDIQQESTFFSDEEVLMSAYVFCSYWIIDISLSKLFQLCFCLHVTTLRLVLIFTAPSCYRSCLGHGSIVIEDYK